MTLYKRIPKTLWQRLWFRSRPQVVKNVQYYESGFVQYQDKDGYTFVNTVAGFEANYEPVFICDENQKMECRACVSDEERISFEETKKKHQEFLLTHCNCAHIPSLTWENNPLSMLYKNKLPTEE